MRRITLLIGLLFSIPEQAQWLNEPVMRHWGTTEGLPSLSVTALAMDAKGFLWIGTTNGVFRFDGRLFEEFPTREANGPSMPSRHATALLAHSDRVLVGTKGGAWVIDAQGRAHTIECDRTHGTSTPSIRALFRMRDGTAVMTTENSTCLRLTQDSDTHAEAVRFSESGASFSALLDMRNGTRVLCLNGSGLLVPGHGDFGVSIHGSRFPYPGHTLTALHEIGPDRVLGTGWDNAVHLFDLQRMSQEQRVLPSASALSYSDNEITCSLLLPDGRFAMGTKRSGLFFFDASRSAWSSDEPILPGASIQSMLVDDGRLWLGTTEGLYLIRPGDNGQRILRLKDRQGDERIKSLFRWPDGRVGAVSNARVWRDVNDTQAPGLGPFKDRLGGLVLYAAHGMTDGRLFIGSQRSIHRLDADAHDLRHVRRSWGPIRADDISSSAINSIAERHSTLGTEILWSAYGHGLFSMHPDAMEPVFTSSVQPEGGDHLVRRAHIDREGRIWQAGAAKGITEIVGLLSCDSIIRRYRAYEEGATTTYPLDGFCTNVSWSTTQAGRSRTALDASDIIEDRDDGYWCSAGGGLYRFRPTEPEPFRKVAEVTGLQGLTLDKSGRVWGIASGGLFCYDPSTGTSALFVDALALNGLEGYPVTDAHGHIWATNGEALLAIDVASLLAMRAPPQPRLAALSLFDLRVDSLLSSRTAALPYDHNYLFITPSVVDPSAGNDARFRYRLAGDNERWIALGKDERIALAGLAPGRYELELGASRAASNQWATTAWSFVILPPWWRSWWFMLIVVSGLAGIALLLLRYRSKQRMREQALRDRLARDLHDDIGSTLGSISYFSELGKQQLEEADIAAAHSVMERMGARSREMIARMSDIVWSVDPKNDGGGSLIERMQLFAAEALAAKDIALDFRADANVAAQKLDMVQRRELFLVLKESVTNAVKHAACTKVRVELRIDHGHIVLVVQDNGKGMARSHADRLNGNGLASMHKRAAAIGGRLEITESEGGGTRVHLAAPLRRTA